MALSPSSVNYGPTRYSYPSYVHNFSYSREDRPMTKSRLEWMKYRKRLEEHEIRKQRIIQYDEKKRKRLLKQNCDQTKMFKQRNSTNLLPLQKEHIDTTAESSSELMLRGRQLKTGHQLSVSDHKKTNSSKVQEVAAKLAENVTLIGTENIDRDIEADNNSMDMKAVPHNDERYCTPSGQRQLSRERQDFSLTRNRSSLLESSDFSTYRYPERPDIISSDSSSQMIKQIRRGHTKINRYRNNDRARNVGKCSGRDCHRFKPFREMEDTYFEGASSRRMQCHNPCQSRFHGATEYRRFHSNIQYGERFTSHAMIDDRAIMPPVHIICTHTPCVSVTAPTSCYFMHHVLPSALGLVPAPRPPFLPQFRFPQPRMTFGRNMQDLHRNLRMRPNFHQ